METNNSDAGAVQPGISVSSVIDQTMPVKKKMKLWKKILLGIGTFFLLLIILSMAGTSAPKKVAEKELNLIQSGDLKGAYDITSSDFKTAVSYQDFLKFLDNYPNLKNFKKYKIDGAETDGENSTISGNLIDKSKKEAPFEIAMIKDKEEWKVLSFNLNPTPKADTNSKETKKNIKPQETWGTVLDEPKMGISFQYPNDWEVVRPAEYIVVVTGSKGGNEEWVEFDVMNLPSKTRGGEYDTLDDAVKGLKKGLKDIDKNVRMSDTIEDTIQREDGMTLVAKGFVAFYKLNDVDMEQLRMVVPHGDGLTFHTAAFIAPASKFEKMSDVGKKITESLVIKK